MMLPDYWLKATPARLRRKKCRMLLMSCSIQLSALATAQLFSSRLPWSKWQFLCYLADHHDIALHGSGDPNIALFEPRQSYDLNEFGNQKAIYAASDGLWAMFFAVVDRDRVTSITNACIRLVENSGTVHDPLYVFSVSQSALPHQPWRSGTVYLLPRSSFITQSPMPFGAYQVHFAQTRKFRACSTLGKAHSYTGGFSILEPDPWA